MFMPYHRLYTALARRYPPRVFWSLAAVALLAGLGWLWAVRLPPSSIFAPTATVEVLQGPVIATMQSPAFVYEAGWQLSAIGADPHEPVDPWREPAGRLHFTYTGAELSLLLAAGDYWGYLYVTVDGAPANLLPIIPGNLNSQGATSGYRTFYAPEQQTPTGPTPQWTRIHRAADATQTHEVTIEVWRSWGQTPLRGVAIDALPSRPLPRWPGLALLLGAGWLMLGALQQTDFSPFRRRLRQGVAWALPVLLPSGGERIAHWITPLALLVLGLGVYTSDRKSVV